MFRKYIYYTILIILILSAEQNQPTEVIGSAATPNGMRHNVTVFQPNNLVNPFGYIAPSTSGQPTVTAPPADILSPEITTDEPNEPIGTPLVNQSEQVNPTDINPLDYENKIGNTIYQQGNRLIDVQSVPIKDINTALTPNTQPTISDVPAF
jgi:hypothetical protein